MDAHEPPDTRYDTEEARWQAVLRRDAAADACFVYAVRSSGVYASPSAAARLPRRENVEFFDSAAAAEAAGYRSSRRQGARARAAIQVAWVAQACRLIACAETPPGLEALAAQAGVSPFHFQRVFKAETGLSPKAYATAYRAQRLRESLLAAGTVTDAIYAAGFNSSSRFYETSTQLLGMPPRSYRQKGRGSIVHFALGQCALGAILVAQSAQGICAILLGDEPEPLLRALQEQFSEAELIGGNQAFEAVVAQVVGFVEAPESGLDLPLDIRGTAFQLRVWQALRLIPPGTTVSYAELAARMGSPKAVRAVARACAANTIAVAIPCHRVVRSDGQLAGYRWGVERKRELLQREASQRLSQP